MGYGVGFGGGEVEGEVDGEGRGGEEPEKGGECWEVHFFCLSFFNPLCSGQAAGGGCECSAGEPSCDCVGLSSSKKIRGCARHVVLLAVMLS